MILGIDLGSSSFKAAVYDRSLRLLGEGSSPLPYRSGIGSRIEIPVAGAEDAFRGAVRESLESAGIRGAALEVIAVSSQAQTFTVRSPEGSARVPFISWRDSRPDGRNPAAVLPDVAEHCSLSECVPLLMVSKLAYLQEESAGESVGADGLVLLLPTWFVLGLTGKAVTDDNLAAMSGLYSLRNGGWWDEALSLCGIAESNLPPLAGLGSTAGTTTESAGRYGLPPGIPVILAGNDQTAGAYGAAIHESGAVLVTLGTAQVSYTVCGAMPTPSVGTMRGSYPGGLFYRLAADEYGAGTVSWACSVLPGLTAAAAFDRAAAASPEHCNGVRFIADGQGGSGRWEGETPRTSTADKARAVLTCLTERMALMIELLGPSAAGAPLVAAGGGANSGPWIECLEKRFGRPFGKASAAPTLGAVRMGRSMLIG